jgi:hypothetical protein
MTYEFQSYDGSSHARVCNWRSVACHRKSVHLLDLHQQRCDLRLTMEIRVEMHIFSELSETLYMFLDA